MPAYVVVLVIIVKSQWLFTVNFKAYVKGGAPIYYVKLKLCQGHTYHVKIMWDCLGSVGKLSGYMGGRFQHFISKRPATGKMTTSIRIIKAHCIAGLKQNICCCQKGILH